MTSTSGNLTADRRFDMAMQLRARGDVEAAIDLLQQTLELVRNWPEGRFTMAEMLLEAGQTEAGVHALRAYLLLDPADSMGANAKLTALGLAPVSQDLSPAYVERLFDQYAPRFDTALVEGLKYSAPQQIRSAIDAHFPQRRFERALDLGCGTGLMGAAARDITNKLDGVDLSAGMLAEAKRKNIYDELHHMPLLDALATHADTYDLVLAADVLVYVGDLRPVITAAAKSLSPGGVLAFSLQSTLKEEFHLGVDQRFCHAHAHVMSALEVAGLRVRELTDGSFRRERNEDVPGFLVIAQRPMTNIKMRLAKPDEQKTLEELQRRASLMWEETREALLAHPDAIDLPLTQIHDGHVLVAEVESEIVGFSVVLPRDDSEAELDGLFVEPTRWRLGIGKRLIQEGELMATMRGARNLHVIANTRAREFYLSCGFVQLGEHATRFGIGLSMLKPLTNALSPGKS